MNETDYDAQFFIKFCDNEICLLLSESAVFPFATVSVAIIRARTFNPPKGLGTVFRGAGGATVT